MAETAGSSYQYPAVLVITSDVMGSMLDALVRLSSECGVRTPQHP